MPIIINIQLYWLIVRQQKAGRAVANHFRMARPGPADTTVLPVWVVRYLSPLSIGGNVLRLVASKDDDGGMPHGLTFGFAWQVASHFIPCHYYVYQYIIVLVLVVVRNKGILCAVGVDSRTETGTVASD